MCCHGTAVSRPHQLWQHHHSNPNTTQQTHQEVSRTQAKAKIILDQIHHKAHPLALYKIVPPSRRVCASNTLPDGCRIHVIQREGARRSRQQAQLSQCRWPPQRQCSTALCTAPSSSSAWRLRWHLHAAQDNVSKPIGTLRSLSNETKGHWQWHQVK